MNIRKGTKADIHQLLEITKACANDMIKNEIYQWNEHYPNRKAFENDVDLGQLYVLINDNIIIGCIVVSSIIDEEYKDLNWLTKTTKHIYIHRLAVHPDYQNSGFAHQLMNFAEDFARENNYVSVRLDTFSINKKNNAFYLKRAYKKIDDVIYFPKQSEFHFNCYELVL